MNDALLAELCNPDRAPFHRLPMEAQAYMRAHPTLVQWWSRDDGGWTQPTAAPANWNLESYRIPRSAIEFPEPRPNEEVFRMIATLPEEREILRCSVRHSLTQALHAAGGNDNLSVWEKDTFKDVLDLFASNGIRFHHEPDVLAKAKMARERAAEILGNVP